MVLSWPEGDRNAMPMLTVKYHPWKGEGSAVEQLAVDLRYVVAEALNCEDTGGQLTSKDIEVEPVMMPAGMRSKYDIHILIEANDYPSRKENLGQRTEKIRAYVRTVLDQHCGHFDHKPKAWVWVRLAPGCWVEV